MEFKEEYLKELMELEQKGLLLNIPIELVESPKVFVNDVSGNIKTQPTNMLDRLYQVGSFLLFNNKTIEGLNEQINESMKIFIYPNEHENTLYYSGNELRIFLLKKKKLRKRYLIHKLNSTMK